MEQISEQCWILSALELNLCVQMLGNRGWDGAPVIETGQPLEQRMLEALFRLVELGLVEAVEGGYRCAQQMKQLLWPVAWPRRVIMAGRAGREGLNLYQNGEGLCAVQQIETESQSFRVYSVAEDQTLDVLAEAMGSLPENPAQKGKNAPTPSQLLHSTKAVVMVLDGSGKQTLTAAVLEADGGFWISPDRGAGAAPMVPYTRAQFAALFAENEG